MCMSLMGVCMYMCVCMYACVSLMFVVGCIDRVACTFGNEEQTRPDICSLLLHLFVAFGERERSSTDTTRSDNEPNIHFTKK